MTTTLIILAIVLILAVLILLFRVSALLSVARGTDAKKGGLLNKFNASMFLVFLVGGTIAFFWYTIRHQDDYLLPTASSIHGVGTDNLMLVTMIVVILIFLLVNAVLFIFAWKYQYKEENRATYYPENSILELLWTVVPAIVLTFLVFSGWQQWTRITTPPTRAQLAVSKPIEFEIVGQQFQWSFRCPGEDGKLGEHNFRRIDASNPFGIKEEDINGLDDFSPKPVDPANTEKKPEIHIPVNRLAHMKIRAKDVLHSVFIPHMRVKMDAVPGHPTEFWFTPTVTTQEMRNRLENQDFNYEIACTEICGKGHFKMKGILIVDSEEEYAAWEKSQKPWSIDDYTRGYIARKLNIVAPSMKRKVLAKLDKLSLAYKEIEEEEEAEVIEEPVENTDVEVVEEEASTETTTEE